MDKTKEPLRAWVAFTGKTDLRWLKILSPGFRHCFVMLYDGSHWMTFEPLAAHSEIKVHDVPDRFNLPQFFRAEGYTVLPAQLNHVHSRALPISFYSCVEAVKRLLGLRKTFIFTPYQLYRYLHKQQMKEI